VERPGGTATTAESWSTGHLAAKNSPTGSSLLAGRAAATAETANDRPVLIDLGQAPADPNRYQSRERYQYRTRFGRQTAPSPVTNLVRSL
jgi:hypothetical protein